MPRFIGFGGRSVWVRFPSPAPLQDYVRKRRTTRPSPNQSMLGEILGFSVVFEPVSLSQFVLGCPSIRTCAARSILLENARHNFGIGSLTGKAARKWRRGGSDWTSGAGPEADLAHSAIVFAKDDIEHCPE